MKAETEHRIGECFDCDEHDIEVFTEHLHFTRDYCAKCIRRCVFCGGYCDWIGCHTDEGRREFERHDCIVDGKITCRDKRSADKCDYHYCMNCTIKCEECNFNIVLRDGTGICTGCLTDNNLDDESELRSE